MPPRRDPSPKSAALRWGGRRASWYPSTSVGPPHVSGLGEKTRSPAEKQRDQEVDQAYKSTTEKIPDRNAKIDPGRDMRGTSASRNSQTKP